jgi:hypothetical protein
MYGKPANRLTFQHRHPILQRLEGEYDGFTLSCRHKDILRCSISRHFRSCYVTKNERGMELGINEHVPYHLCRKSSFAIIGKKDRSGDYLWRAIIQYMKPRPTSYQYDDEPVRMTKESLTVYRFYGNPPDEVRVLVFNALNHKVQVAFCEWDAN